MIPAICYAIDREGIIDAVLLGQGIPAYGPLQRNIYNNEKVEHYDYDPEKAKEVLESEGCVMGNDGYYEKDGEAIGFVISVGAGDQVRIDIAQAVAQQLQEVGIDCSVEIPVQVDWGGQMAYLIGWGSPLTQMTILIRCLAQKKEQITVDIPIRRLTNICSWPGSRINRKSGPGHMQNSRKNWPRILLLHLSAMWMPIM